MNDKKTNQCYCYIEIWIEDQASYVSLSQSLIQSRALTFFTFMKADRGEEAEEKFGAIIAEIGSWGLRSHLCNIKVYSEAASAIVKAAVSYQENPAKITNKGGYIKWQIFSVDKKASMGRKCHLKLS